MNHMKAAQSTKAEFMFSVYKKRNILKLEDLVFENIERRVSKRVS